MNMKRKRQFLIAMLCAFSMLGNSAAVLAQSKDKKQEAKSSAPVREVQVVDLPSDVLWVGEPGQDPAFQFPVPTLPPELAIAQYLDAPQVEFIHNEFNFDGKVVKGAPYSADAVTETIQTMGDGNRIIQNSTAKIYRDGAGRTRREQPLNLVGPWSVSGDAPVMINISDPVSGVHYNLDPNTRTANKMTVRRVSNVNGDMVATFSVSSSTTKLKKVNVEGEKGGDQLKFVTDDNRTVILSGEGADKGVVELRAAEMKAIKDVGPVSGAVAVASGGAVAGERAFAFSSGPEVNTFSSDAEVNKESLGTQTIEGVQAEGTRVTFTIPAGKIGNERPIVTVNERWYSPELQTVVMSKNSDPRMGETTYRLTNIVRSEPDPGLFQVPADYTVKEGGFGFTSARPAEMLRKIETEKKARKPNEN